MSIFETKFLRFKEDYLSDQFISLQTHPALVGLVFSLGLWFFTKFKKPLIITAVWRTKAEQQKLYGTQNPPESPHYCNPRCRAVDVRVRDWSEDEELATIGWIQFHFPRDDDKKTAFIHGDGDSRHCHIQYPSKNGYDGEDT